MSLKFFHILFISVSALMCLVVAVWALDAYREDGSAGSLLLTGAAVVGGGGLVVYGTRFLQKARKLGLAGLLVAGTLGSPSELLACTVCLGNTHSSLRDGMNAGILALLAFTLFMIGSFGAFFIYLWRRGRRLAAAGPAPGYADSSSGFNVPQEGRSNA